MIQKSTIIRHKVAYEMLTRLAPLQPILIENKEKYATYRSQMRGFIFDITQGIKAYQLNAFTKSGLKLKPKSITWDHCYGRTRSMEKCIQDLVDKTIQNADDFMNFVNKYGVQVGMTSEENNEMAKFHKRTDQQYWGDPLYAYNELGFKFYTKNAVLISDDEMRMLLKYDDNIIYNNKTTNIWFG